MLSENDARQTIGSTAYSTNGDKIGTVGQLFLDDETGRPEFITVNTGLFGNKESFVPVADATFDGDRLTVPFDKDKIKGAPQVDTEDGHLDRSDEERLYEYYGLQYGGSGTGYETDSYQSSGTAGYETSTTGRTEATGTETAGTGTLGTGTTGTGTTGRTETPDVGRAGTDVDSGTTGRVTDDRRSEGYDTSGPTTDEAMTRSEERVQVGTTSQEVGRARLRKYVTTEQETHTVPVRKEKAVLETEPITDANRGDATSGPDISEEEHEVVLNEERVMVDKTTEPVERVRLGTETVTDEETVTEDVRKERIEAEGDVDRRDG